VRELVAYKDGRLYKIKWSTGGVLHRDLRGGYTSLDGALDAIDYYNEHDKRLWKNKSKHQQAVIARKLRNA